MANVSRQAAAVRIAGNLALFLRCLFVVRACASESKAMPMGEAATVGAYCEDCIGGGACRIEVVPRDWPAAQLLALKAP